MKKWTLFLAALAALLIGTTPAMALPYLQLGISGGIYDNSTQTVTATSPSFTLYALVDTTSTSYVAGSTYYISAAVAPQLTAGGADLGSFTWDSISFDATQDMVYGTAPIEGVNKCFDLPGHGIFPTYFTEFSFMLNPADTAAEYNVQNNPDGFSIDPNGMLRYAAFDLDVSGLLPDYALHFDLYTVNGDGIIDKFAPFSHDAQSASVPEPASLLLLGTGLIGLAALGRKRFKINR